MAIGDLDILRSSNTKRTRTFPTNGDEYYLTNVLPETPVLWPAYICLGRLGLFDGASTKQQN
jgi:hypothetical protein